MMNFKYGHVSREPKIDNMIFMRVFAGLSVTLRSLECQKEKANNPYYFEHIQIPHICFVSFC